MLIGALSLLLSEADSEPGAMVARTKAGIQLAAPVCFLPDELSLPAIPRPRDVFVGNVNQMLNDARLTVFLML
jgi:hypothetical protein